MNCPLCAVPMIRGDVQECRTGNARKFIYPKCRAWQWQPIEVRDANFNPLRETMQRLAAAAI